MEGLSFGEQVKIILSRKNMTIKELAELIQEQTGKVMSRQNLTQRLGRDNFQEKDMRTIAAILGCPFRLSIFPTNPEEDEKIMEYVHVGTQSKRNRRKKEEEDDLYQQTLVFDENPEEKKEEVVTAEEVPSGEKLAEDERDMTIGELYAIHEELKELEQPENKELRQEKKEALKKDEKKPEREVIEPDSKDFEPVIKYDDVEEDLESGEMNPYTGREYQTNSVRMHPTRIGYVQVYDRKLHQWTDMTEWAFLGYQERKKALLGKEYEPPIYLD